MKRFTSHAQPRVHCFSRRVAVIVFGLATVLCPFADAQLTNEQKSRLDQIATQDVPKGAPGIATGIVLDGKIIYSMFAGLEDIATEKPISAWSRFNIASNGKQFTALAILQLEADGKLSIKDDVRKYFPGIYSGIKSPITIEHLLTHTSGIRDVYELWAIQGKTWWKFEFGNDDAMELLAKQEDLNFAPGSEHLYSNSNYILLAELVSKICQKSFVVYTDAMFQQLDMPDTSFEADHTSIRGPIAKPYFNFQTWQGYEWLPDIVGDGCLFSTLHDQLQWELLVQGSGKSKFDKSLIIKSQQLVDVELCCTYGFGLEHRNENGVKSRFHSGSTGAWKAFTLRYPERKCSIVTLSNSGKTTPSMQSRQMVDLFFETKAGSTSSQTRPTQPESVSVDWSDFDFESLNGIYANAETGSEFKLAHVDGLEYSVTIKGKKARNAQLVSRNKLVLGNFVVQWSGIFDSQTDLLLSSGRLRNVKFVRQTSTK